MSIFCDFLLLLIIFVSILIAAKEGFIKAFFSFITSLASLVLAFLLSNPLANLLKKMFLLDKMTQKIDAALPKNLGINNFNSISNNKFIQLIGKFGKKFDEVKEYCIGNDAGTSVRESAVAYIADAIATVIAIMISFALIYVVVKITLGGIGRILDLVSKLPLLNASNKLLGFAFGALRGLIIAILIARLLVFSEPLIQSIDDPMFRDFDTQNTVIIKSLDAINPLKELMKIGNLLNK